MALVLNTFLGCFELRTGCLFMGYSGAIISFIAIIASFMGIVVTGQRENVLEGEAEYVNEVLHDACIFFLVACSIAFILYVVLLKGVHQNRPKLLKGFLISMTTYMVILFILAVIVTVMSPSFGIRFVTSFAISIYYMLVVRSYYLKLKEDMQEQNEMKPV